jgi:hypothetical protein
MNKQTTCSYKAPHSHNLLPFILFLPNSNKTSINITNFYLIFLFLSSKTILKFFCDPEEPNSLLSMYSPFNTNSFLSLISLMILASPFVYFLPISSSLFVCFFPYLSFLYFIHSHQVAFIFFSIQQVATFFSFPHPIFPNS